MMIGKQTEHHVTGLVAAAHLAAGSSDEAAARMLADVRRRVAETQRKTPFLRRRTAMPALGVLLVVVTATVAIVLGGIEAKWPLLPAGMPTADWIVERAVAASLPTSAPPGSVASYRLDRTYGTPDGTLEEQLQVWVSGTSLRMESSHTLEVVDQALAPSFSSRTLKAVPVGTSTRLETRGPTRGMTVTWAEEFTALHVELGRPGPATEHFRLPSGVSCSICHGEGGNEDDVSVDEAIWTDIRRLLDEDALEVVDRRRSEFGEVYVITGEALLESEHSSPRQLATRELWFTTASYRLVYDEYQLWEIDELGAKITRLAYESTSIQPTTFVAAEELPADFFSQPPPEQPYTLSGTIPAEYAEDWDFGPLYWLGSSAQNPIGGEAWPLRTLGWGVAPQQDDSGKPWLIGDTHPRITAVSTVYQPDLEAIDEAAYQAQRAASGAVRLEVVTLPLLTPEEVLVALEGDGLTWGVRTVPAGTHTVILAEEAERTIIFVQMKDATVRLEGTSEQDVETPTEESTPITLSLDELLGFVPALVRAN